MLFLTLITDLYWFVRHSYTWSLNRTQESTSYPEISLRAFNKIYNTVAILDGEKYNAKKLVLDMNKHFRVSECIFGVLYTNKG